MKITFIAFFLLLWLCQHLLGAVVIEIKRQSYITSKALIIWSPVISGVARVEMMWMPSLSGARRFFLGLFYAENYIFSDIVPVGTFAPIESDTGYIDFCLISKYQPIHIIVFQT